MPKDYHQIRIKKQLKTKKVLKKMSPEQREAIKEIQESVAQCINMIKECNDLYMSDISKLELSYHNLTWAFEVDDV
jgi:hypothetical protein